VPASQLVDAIEAVARGERYLSPRAVDTVLMGSMSAEDAKGQPLW
jgi:DNA-binding NarL/FixJ family response regulator